ncbi:putative ankyrin repeat protein [Paramyrothecium foliicola]|nr:putative ankyrin repeat protein [Paramyrothecium foliicola]
MSKQEIDQIWEIHKPLLWSLWVKDKKPMKELREGLKKRGFSATESQYKRRFEDWGFQQKISVQNWKVIGHRVEKRKREGLDSAVVIDGVYIAKRKVQKEISRHFFQTKELMNNPNPPLPGTALVSITSPLSFSLLDVDLTWSDEMPWINFINTYFRNTYFQQYSQRDSIHSLPSITSRRPNTDVAVRLDYLPNMDVLVQASRMAARMPECFTGQHLLDSQTLALGRPCDAEQIKVKLVLYRMANNFEISEVSFELFYKVMSRNIITQFSKVPMSMTGLPRAILERAFREAILLRRSDILRWTLDLGVSPHLKIPDRRWPGLYHLPFVHFLELRKSECVEDDIIDLLLKYEKPGSHGIIDQHCCEYHGTLMEYTVQTSSLVVLVSLMNREIELHGSKFLGSLDAARLLLLVRDTEPGEAEKMISYIIEVYTQIHNSSENLIKGFLCAKGMLEAAIKGSNALIRYLCQHGADFNCHDEFGNFPLGVCCQNWCSRDKIKTLLELGASATYTPWNTARNNIFSVLHYAVLRQDPELSCLLLDHGALLMGDELVRLAQHSTNTSMDKGVILTVVKRLVAGGIDPNLETDAGETALDISIRNDTADLAFALIHAGSRPSDTMCAEYKWLLCLQGIFDLEVGRIRIVDCIAFIQEFVSWAPEVASDLWIVFFETIKSEYRDFEAEFESAGPILFLAIDQIPEKCHLHALRAIATLARRSTRKARQSSIGFSDFMLSMIQPLECPAPCARQQELIKHLFGELSLINKDYPEVFDEFVSSLMPCQGMGRIFTPIHNDPFILLFSAYHCTEEQATEREQLVRKLFARRLQPTTLAGLSCVARGTVNEIQMFIDHGFNPKRRYPWSSTALQIAYFRGDPQIIALLLGSRVQVNSRPAWRSRVGMHFHGEHMPFRSHTALQAAVSQGNQEHIKLLLDAGADVNAKPAPVAGATALQLAALNGDVGIANWLIAGYGADPNAPGAPTLGRTALEGAAEQGRLEMVYLLLQSGCLIVGDGRPQFIRAVIRAEDNQHQALASILKKEGQWSSIDDEQYRVQKEAMDVERRTEAKMKHGEYFGPVWDQSSDGECCDDSACDCCLDN